MTLEQLHARYCAISGRQVPLEFNSYAERSLWTAWMQCGWTEHDLEQVIRWLQGKIKRGERRPESLRLYNLLDPARFIDDLIDSKQSLRLKPKTAKSEILSATNRPEQPSETCQPAKAIVPKLTRLFDEMRKAIE